MASTFTPNIQLEEPARGDDVGTWDTPVNNNMSLVDKVAGAIATISLNNSPIVLSAAQFQSAAITFNSTLTGSVAITFPTSFTKSYKIRNSCTGSSAFVITLGTTASGGQVICCPPGESIDCVNDGTNIYFHNLERVGSYWDYIGSSVPGWVSGCTVPPYIPADGTSFSSATYPQLAVILNGTTTPDTRGRVRAMLDQGQARLSSVLTSSTIGAAGGNQNMQSHSHSASVTDPGHTHSVTAVFNAGGNTIAGGSNFNLNGTTQNTASAGTGISVSIGSAGAGASQNVQPTYIGGITMIRAG